MAPTEQKQITLSDRITAAIAAALFVGLSVILFGLALLFLISVSTLTRLDGAGAKLATDTSSFLQIAQIPLVKALGKILLLTSATGFIFGTDRIVRWFGILWRTEEGTRCEQFGLWVVVLGLLAYIIYSVLNHLA